VPGPELGATEPFAQWTWQADYRPPLERAKLHRPDLDGSLFMWLRQQVRLLGLELGVGDDAAITKVGELDELIGAPA
jgi:hypothetical protein